MTPAGLTSPETLPATGSIPVEGLLDTIDTERWLRTILILLLCLWMIAAILLPLGQLLLLSAYDQAGRFVGLGNFLTYFRTPALSASLLNSVVVSVLTTALSVSLAFLYAYALTRTCMPGTGFFWGVAMLPLFAPTLLNGIALVYLFGRKGLITTGLLGAAERWLGLPLRFDIGLYGPVGIILGEMIYIFPQAVLILAVALRMTDSRLYEASDSLRASRPRTFLTVTLPGVKYGLVSATLVSFILSFTDFGVPKVVGGNYNVLATDIYKQVIGQQNFVMGATVSVVLLLPAAVAFLLDRLIQRRQMALIAARSVPLRPKPYPWRDLLALAYCGLIAALVLGFFATAGFASLVKVWPYDLSLTLRHYDFRSVGGGGYAALWNSIRMALYSAAIGTLLTFASAFLVEKSRGLGALRQVAYFLSILPLALPGLVIGLAYIFFFNTPRWSVLGLSVWNPGHLLYGTMGILVLSNIVHFYTVGFLTATTALKQLDREFEAVSESMGVPFYVTFARVTVPVCLPAILEVGMYLFVNSMATVSAVIFLYSADIPLATVAVANMDDAGDIAPAAAMSMLIVLVNVGIRVLYGAATRGLQRRTQAWTSA
jgi:iron(III) transport system permease protein